MRLHPDAIPTSDQVRETLFDRYYFPYRRQIWGLVAVLLAAILVVLGMREWENRQRDEQWTRFAVALAGDSSSQTGPADQTRSLEERVALLRRLVLDFPKAPVTPYALMEITSAQTSTKRFDEARKTLAELRARFPDFAFSRATTADLGETTSIPLADRLDSALRNEEDWLKATAYVHPEPAKNRAALIETTGGSFWIGFYPEQAPNHVDAFVKNAKSGWFSGTQVYQARSNLIGGTPSPLAFEAAATSSKANAEAGFNPDPAVHDQDEPDFTIDPEDSRYTIHHRRGVVSAVTMASGESARRFMVVTAPGGMEGTYNGRNSVFGSVLEKEQSLAVIDRITMVPTYGTSPETKDSPLFTGARDHPMPHVYIRRVTIWSDEKLETGHTWDTSRAGTAEPEPWEATLPPK